MLFRGIQKSFQTNPKGTDMKYKPTGYRVLIQMDEVEQQVKDGVLKGFQLQSDKEHEREEAGHCIGKIIAFGPTAFLGYEGCKPDSAPKDWGVEVGDMVEFNRYDGKIPLHDEKKEFRLVNDSDILMVVTDA